MDTLLSLETGGATYSINVLHTNGKREITHFMFNCACTPDDALFRPGSDVRDAADEFMVHREHWQQESVPPVNNTHTFYINEPLFEQELRARHTERPMRVICRGCDAQYAFTRDSYQRLVERIESEADDKDPTKPLTCLAKYL